MNYELQITNYELKTDYIPLTPFKGGMTTISYDSGTYRTKASMAS